MKISDLAEKDRVVNNCLQHENDHHQLSNKYDLHQKEILMLV